jgi:hypothetical protein
MRIALCLSGQPRTWRRTRESLMAFFAGHELDVFLHTWREGDPAEIAALQAAYAPRALKVEERPLFVAEKRLLAANFPVRPPLTVFDMLHSVAASLALAAQSGETYDLVVRARFDALFQGRWTGGPPGEGELVLPDDYPDAASCNDQFAIGRPAEMAAYGALASWFPGALTGLRGEWLRPEALLRSYLEAVCSLRLRLTPIAMRLLREGGPDDAAEDDPLFHAAKHLEWEAFAKAHFPEVAQHADFDHPSRTPLALDRALEAWAQDRGPAAANALFAAPWAERLAAVEAFLAEQSGGVAEFDEDAFDSLRLVCAALLQRMDRSEPLCPRSAVVHMLSDNIRDMRRVDDWLRANPQVIAPSLAAAPPGGLLARAPAYKPPLTAYGHDVWRR